MSGKISKPYCGDVRELRLRAPILRRYPPRGSIRARILQRYAWRGGLRAVPLRRYLTRESLGAGIPKQIWRAQPPRTALNKIFDRFFGAKIGPKWIQIVSQNPSKIDPKSACFFDRVLDAILIPKGYPKWSPKASKIMKKERVLENPGGSWGSTGG